MNLLKKLHFYKRALQTMIALNIAVVTAGVIAGTSYFSSIQFSKMLTKQNADRLAQLQAMQNDLVALAHREPGKKVPYSHIRHLESLRLKLEAWPGSAFAQIALPESLEEATVSPQLAGMIQERIVKEQTVLRDQLVEAANKIGSLSTQLAWLGFFTLVFGILAPFFVFKYLMKEIASTRHKVEEKVSHWIAQWFETHAKHGEKPLQDPTFWLKIILLTVEEFAPHSQHPIVHFLGEFAPTLRKEIEQERQAAIEKVKDKKSA